MGTIASYDYTYGAGSKPNRKVEFFRPSNNPQDIFARVFAIAPNGEIEISRLPGAEITVEMMSSSDKFNALIAERNGAEIADAVPNRLLSELNIDRQNEILRGLEPTGSWRMEITNGFSRDPRYEKVARLNLFNPG